MIAEMTEYQRLLLESMAEITSHVTDFSDDLPPRKPAMTGALIEIDNEVHSDDWDGEC